MNKFIIVKHFLSSFIFDESLIAEITANENKILKQLKEMQEAQTINAQILDENIESNTKKIIYYTIGFFAFVGICYLFMYGNDGGDSGILNLTNYFNQEGIEIVTKLNKNYSTLLKTIQSLSHSFEQTNYGVPRNMDILFAEYNGKMCRETFTELFDALASNGKQLTTISKMLETINRNNSNSSTYTGDITEL